MDNQENIDSIFTSICASIDRLKDTPIDYLFFFFFAKMLEKIDETQFVANAY